MFSEILHEEMHKKGGLVTPVGEAFGRWQGLDARVKDYEITWPPMVLIMNTRYEQEENGKVNIISPFHYEMNYLTFYINHFFL
jgi:hypothetical protein